MGIIHRPFRPRFTVPLLLVLAVMVYPFAATGRTSGIVIALLVWLLIGMALIHKFRSRNAPETDRQPPWVV
jgi:hypothetical protein